jgi:hypothetical protein
MNGFFKTIVCLLIGFQVAAQKMYQLPKTITSGDYIEKTIIIKVKPQFSNVCSNNKIDHSLFNSLFSSIASTNLHKKFPFDKSPEKLLNSAGQAYADLSLIYELNYTSNLQIDKAISKLL